MSLYREIWIPGRKFHIWAWNLNIDGNLDYLAGILNCWCKLWIRSRKSNIFARNFSANFDYSPRNLKLCREIRIADGTFSIYEQKLDFWRRFSLFSRKLIFSSVKFTFLAGNFNSWQQLQHFSAKLYIFWKSRTFSG